MASARAQATSGPNPAGPATQQAGYRMGPFDPAGPIKGLGAFIGFGLAVSGLYATTGIGFPCPFRALTGWQCPFCGGTRLGSALLHAHLGQAFLYNPAVFCGLVILTILGMLWIVEALGGPAVRPPRRVAEALVRVHPTVWTAVILGSAVGYTIARNLVGF